MPHKFLADVLYSAVPQPWKFHCEQCEAFAQELRDAWEADQQEIRVRFFETAQAGGREPGAFLVPWIESLAELPDAEFDALQEARYPRVADVRRRWKQHEKSFGHCGLADGWRAAFIFDGVTRGGYGAFLKRRD